MFKYKLRLFIFKDFMCVGILPVCLSAPYVYSALCRPNRLSDAMEMKLLEVVSRQVGAGKTLGSLE